MSREITFTVKSPRGHTDSFTFNRDTKVGQAAQNVADEYEYDASDPTFTLNGDPLDRNRPLTSYQLDGETVILSNAGRGA